MGTINQRAKKKHLISSCLQNFLYYFCKTSRWKTKEYNKVVKFKGRMAPKFNVLPTPNRQALQVIMAQHHVCHHDALPKIILQGSVDGSRRRGRPRKSGKDNIKEWKSQSMSLIVIAMHRG